MPRKTNRAQSPWPSHYIGQRVKCRFLLIKSEWQPFGLRTPLVNEPWLRSSADGPIIEASFEAVLTDHSTVTWVPEACRFWQLPIIETAMSPDVSSSVIDAMSLLETPIGTEVGADARFIVRRSEAEAKVVGYVWNGDETLKEQAFVKARELILTGRVIGAWVRHGNCSDPYKFRSSDLLLG